jgi:hypothetical protein
VDNRAGRNTVHAADAGSAGVTHASRRAKTTSKEVSSTLPNPLAIGVTLGGLLLDIVAPRPKPRFGVPRETSPFTRSADVRTPMLVHEVHDGSPVASGNLV